MKQFFWLHRSVGKDAKSPTRIEAYKTLAETLNRPLAEILAEKADLHPRDGDKFSLVMWYFSRLSACRDYGMGGASAITHQEIESWARLERVNLTRTELDVLREVDMLFLRGLTEDD